MDISVKVNDIHVHIGKSSGIFQSYSSSDIHQFRSHNNIDNILVFGADQDATANNIAMCDLVTTGEEFYGLYWVDGVAEFGIDDRIVGAKYHGAYLQKPITPEDWWLESLDYKKALLMVHCGRYKEGGIESNTSYLHALEVAKQFPSIKVIMAHMGGTDTTVCKRAINDSRDYDNVYFDTSGITTPHIIEFAVTRISSERILFGSDAPWCSFRAMLCTVLDAQISEEDKHLILYENFNSLIKGCALQQRQSTRKSQSVS